MLADGRSTYEGRSASVRDAINVPRGLQEPRIPIMVGGNGPNRTWRLAARFADELNLDGMRPADVREVMPIIAERCREAGRDPVTLKVSVHWWAERLPSDPRKLLEGYREAGVSRVMGLVRASATDDEALPALRAAAIDAGATFADEVPRAG